MSLIKIIHVFAKAGETGGDKEGSAKLISEKKWTKEAWREAGFTPFNAAGVREKAHSRGEITQALQTRKRPEATAKPGGGKTKKARKQPQQSKDATTGGGGGGGGGCKKKKENAMRPIQRPVDTPKDRLRTSFASIKKAVYPNPIGMQRSPA